MGLKPLKLVMIQTIAVSENRVLAADLPRKRVNNHAQRVHESFFKTGLASLTFHCNARSYVLGGYIGCPTQIVVIPIVPSPNNIDCGTACSCTTNSNASRWNYER